jgi:small-conductance mechanosensitive channel
LLLSALLAVAFTWIGLTIGFYSPDPVSFLISGLALLASSRKLATGRV